MMRMREVRESFQSLNIAGMQMMAISGGILMGYSITTHVLIEDLVAGEYEIEIQAFSVGTNE